MDLSKHNQNELPERERKAETEENNNSFNELSMDKDEMYGCQIICCSKTTKRYPISSMQCINNAKGALIFLCIPLFLANLINAGLFNAVISTIEKRFQLQSTESGLIASSFDVFTCIALLVTAFSGDKAFKPMWLGWGTFVIGIGSVLYALPHFTAPPYSIVDNNTGLCGVNVTNPRCEGTSIRNYMYLFIFANGLIGLGSTPLFTVAITYLDENVKQKNSGLYGGIYYSMGAFGPAVGYLLGSALVNVYTNIGENVDITSASSLWIGAWWIGFLVVGIICIVISILIIMFPRNLPGTSRFRENRNKEVHRNKSSINAANNETFGKSWKDAPKVLWLLMTNIPYVSLTLSSCINYAFVYGFNTFGAKYIAAVFGISISNAALIFGTAAIVAAAGGQLFGGYVITKFKMTVGEILKFMILCTAICLVAVFGFLLRCQGREFSGPTLEDIKNSADTSGCSNNCHCSTDYFKPVCGDDGISYFSSCFAGCRLQVNESHYHDCSCVSSKVSGNETVGSGLGILYFGATADECSENNCALLYPFIGIVLIAFLTTLTKTTPNLQATIRCIPFNLRTTAISLQRLVFTLLGTIPGRILTGKVLDLACISWGTECGDVGACRAYDTNKASLYMTLLLAVQMFICLILQIITFAIYKPSYANEDGEKSDEPGAKNTQTNDVEVSEITEARADNNNDDSIKHYANKTNGTYSTTESVGFDLGIANSAYTSE
ncbi:solute carrier organic anion transporter family member 4A1-like isoform X1 [Styela clava]